MRHLFRFRIGARRALMAAVLVTFAGAGCRLTAPSTDVPFSAVDLTVGTGDAAVTGQVLTVDYTGFLYDSSQVGGKGRQFDTSIGRGVFIFQLSKGNVIDGWVQGVPGMKVGGTRRLVIPPSLAYGARGVTSQLPPNATLIFDITLISTQTPVTARLSGG